LESEHIDADERAASDVAQYDTGPAVRAPLRQKHLDHIHKCLVMLSGSVHARFAIM
jgi:hypothetical protein